MMNLKITTVAAAIVFACSSAFAADAMTKDEVKAAKERIEADYKAAKDKCVSDAKEQYGK